MGTANRQSKAMLRKNWLLKICHPFITAAEPGRELQYAQISAVELVQAVHEMLSAVGISMNVEKHSLMQKTITLQEQLQESRAAILL